MRKNYNRLIISIIVVFLAGAFAFSQEKEVEYKDVILDGKPAKLNTATGEIKLINSEDIKEPVALNDFVTEAKVEKDTSLTTDYYTVKEGETLFEIANRFNTSLTELKRANGLETTLVNKGQKLRVKNFESIESTLVDSSSSPSVSERNDDFHTVENGETLYSLSKRYGLTVNELKTKNGLTSNLIKIGQKLKIKDFNSNTELGYVSVWTVSKGDTLYSIAKENGITVQQIKNLNGLTTNLIKIGQKLQLN